MNIIIIKLLILKILIGLNFREYDTRTERRRKWEQVQTGNRNGTGKETVSNGNGNCQGREQERSGKGTGRVMNCNRNGQKRDWERDGQERNGHENGAGMKELLYLKLFYNYENQCTVVKPG